jgi:hypothetical protein
MQGYSLSEGCTFFRLTAAPFTKGSSGDRSNPPDMPLNQGPSVLVVSAFCRGSPCGCPKGPREGHPQGMSLQA